MKLWTSFHTWTVVLSDNTSKNHFRTPPVDPLVEPPVDPLQPLVEFPVSDFSKSDRNESLQKGTRDFLAPLHTFLTFYKSQLHLPLPPNLYTVITSQIISIFIPHKNTQK